MRCIADKRTTFCHSVADRKREFDFSEKSFHFRTQRCPANYRFMEVPAKAFDQTFPGFIIDQVPYSRYSQQCFDYRFFQRGYNSLLVDLLYDQRNQQNEMRFHFSKSFQQNLRSRNFGQKCNMAPQRNRKEILKGEPKYMRHGQYRDNPVAGFE